MTLEAGKVATTLLTGDMSTMMSCRVFCADNSANASYASLFQRYSFSSVMYELSISNLFVGRNVTATSRLHRHRSGHY